MFYSFSNIQTTQNTTRRVSPTFQPSFRATRGLHIHHQPFVPRFKQRGGFAPTTYPPSLKTSEEGVARPLPLPCPLECHPHTTTTSRTHPAAAAPPPPFNRVDALTTTPPCQPPPPSPQLPTPSNHVTTSPPPPPLQRLSPASTH